MCDGRNKKPKKKSKQKKKKNINKYDLNETLTPLCD